MLLPKLLIFGSFVQLGILVDSIRETGNATWYKGCFRSTSRRQFPVVRDYQTVPECALHCENVGYNYSLIQTINDQFQCGCTQSLVTMETADCCDTSRMSRLQVGLRYGCWGVYETLGPYLTMVSLDTDFPVIVIDEPTTMEIFVKRAAAYNLSDDDIYTGHHLDIVWRLRHTNHLYQDIAEFWDYTEIYHRFKHIFPNRGNYTIDVHVSNGISELETSLDVEVVYPEPHDLQLGFPDGLPNLPSCIPEEYYINNGTSSVLAVFVNTSVQLEASVSLGTNLTFTFLFEDSNEEINVELLGRNLSVLQEHTFREIGTYRLTVTAENIYGSRNVTVTMIVVERQLSDLHINLEPSNSFIATVGTPIWFNISVITTTRDNLYLQVWYSDGDSNIVLLSDTDRPALILTGDGKDMEIIADYGDGCELIVEFSYIYMQEGLYKPRVSISDKFDESIISKKLTEGRHVDKKAEYLDEMNTEYVEESYDNYKENKQYAIDGFPDIISEGVVTDNPRSKFGSYNDLQVFEKIIGMQDQLHIQNSLDNVDANFKNNGSFHNNTELLTAELERNIIIVETLDGVRLHGPNVVSCKEIRQFILEVPSKFNVSVHWRVYRVYEQDLEYSGDDGPTDYNVMYQMVHETEGCIFVFNYSFTEVGQYVITAQISNILSNTETKHNVLSMCPVSNLKASCDHEYIQTGHELMCYAEASSGSKLMFEWIIDGYNTEKQFRIPGNFSSIFRYTFTQPDICDISVTAVNNISLAHVIVEPAIRVQDSITDFSVHLNIWAIVRQPVRVITYYQPTSIYDQCCYFGFNYGETEIHGLKGIFHKTVGCYYMSEEIQFEELGRHFVKVSAYNRVSNMSKIIDFWAIPSLENVSIEIIRYPTESNPLRLLVKDQGKAMVTENVYFSWKFEGEAVYFTNSPLIEVSVTGIGESSLNLNATTPVESEVFTVSLNGSLTPKSGLHIEHDLFVSLGNTTKFLIQETLSGCSKVLVNYSDGTFEIYKGSTQRWKHTFEMAGLQEITVTLVDDDGTTLDDETTYVLVEEPIQTIVLHGPSIVKISEVEGISSNKWTAELDGGTNVLYKWTLEETLLTTLPEFEKEITWPGTYKLQVEAWNDISEPVTADISFQVIQIEHPIKDAQLKVIGNLVGKETQILTSIVGHQPFVINVSFGDGYHRELSGNDLSDTLISLSDNSYIVTISHVYTERGEFNITVNVFNDVSSVIVWDVFVPIVNVTIVTSSPWLVRASDFVRVRGEVEGGQDLISQWNFQNEYHETFVTSFDNQTSVATHSYEQPGEYLVSFNVTGKHYPPPGISVVLERPFLVVDPISQVILDVMKNSAELIGNSTSPVIFNAKSTGSHVGFHFDFGDGIQVEAAGSQLSMTEVHLTMTAEARHEFKKEGQFIVKVTASNPVNNITEYLKSPFYVQRPPRNLYFCHTDIHNLPVTSYTGRVGQDILMCANVTMGTNVTFDWKLGDQTDMVKHGSFITHRYSTPGIRNVYVTAKNKVNKAEKSVKVYVNYQLQGVNLVSSTSVVALGELIQYTAVVRPDYNNTASDYTWKFMCPSKSVSRERSENTIHSKQNSIYFKFQKESGICLAKVTARNAISRVSSDTVEIHVIDKIKRLEINLPGNYHERLVNRTILFHSYLFAGTNVTFTWDFGDGNKQVSTSAAYVNHTFTKQKGYNITLNASNPVSIQTVSMLLFVLEKSFCNQPDITIINQPESKIQYSKPFTVEAEIVPDCNLTHIMDYKWMIDGQARKDLQSDKKVLVLPPRYLTFGKHSIEFMVKMNRTIVYAVKKLMVEVVPGPLISKIQGGIYRRIGRSGTITLDGSGSLDPNTNNNQTLRYIWNCSFTSEAGKQGNSCFMQDESPLYNNCNISMMSALLIFPGECLIEASNFTFNLTVAAEDRQSSSMYQILSVTRASTLEVKILRPSLIEPVNADRKLSFYGECSNCPSTVKYRWNLKFVFNSNSYNPARAHDLECVEANGTTYYIVMKQENKNGTKLNGLTEDEQQPQQTIDSEDFVRPINEVPVDSNTSDKGWPINQNNSPIPIDGLEITEGDPGSDILNRRKRESDINNKYMYWMYSENFNISEGKPIHKNRMRKQAGYGGDINMGRYRRSLASETTTFSYPSILQEGDPGSRTIKFSVSAQYEISENTDTNPSRRIPDITNIPIREGSPGESGSSEPRQYGGVSISITEGQGSSRNPNLPQEKDPICSSSADDCNRIETVRSNPNQVYTVLDQRSTQAHLKAEQTKTGLNSESLVIKPGVLKQGLTYIVELSVQHEGLGLEGEAKSSFVVNESPVEGRCSIEPQSGVELDTEFTLLCKEWRDEHKPFMYEVGYREDQNSDKILIYRGVNNYVTFKLPAGTQDNNNKVFVSIDILDALHAKTSVCSIAIQVKPKSYTSLKKLLPGIVSYTEYIYDEVTNKNSSLQKSLEKGDDAMSKVYISYLATKLNKVKASRTNVTENGTILNSRHKTIVDRSIGEPVSHGVLERKVSLADVHIRRDIRTYLLKVLKTLPLRDEAEILQSAQALAFTTAVPTEGMGFGHILCVMLNRNQIRTPTGSPAIPLCPESLDFSLEILKSVTYGARMVYGYNDLTPTGNLIPVVVQSAASIITATRDIGQNADEALETVLKDIVADSIDTIESLVLNELKFHMTSEDPILTSTDFLSVLATRHVSMQKQSLEISDAKFQFPENFASLLDNQQENKSSQLSNQKCFQSHMTTFQKNPYSWTDNKQVNSVVSGLKLFDCLGTPLLVEGLPHTDRIQVELPNLQPQNGPTSNLVLRKWSMNIHQFNVTLENINHALQLVIEFVPVQQGRLFSITVLLSYDRPPNPKFFLYKYDVQKAQNILDIFLPPGSFNVTGKYFIGIVDATFNSGRLRAGEVTYREYGFKLWWGECLYWNVAMETWRPDGCSISRSSSYKVTRCECSHLTAFGGRFDLIPNKLSHEDVDNFFSPNKNPVVLTLISIVFIVYFVLLLWCCHADQHDSQKGGVVYLLDNAPMDQQKYEVTVETGIYGGAGTTAKISLILHGEEGMSETRELISEDNRPMFERNSRDKFILTLPDSIGKIWKVQIWHNNFGESPSWYVTRIIVRDLNTGVPYIFICEKWLAVEEEDGKVEREFMALEGSLDFRKALMSKTSEYIADFHVWLSILTCPSYSGFKRTERLTLCLAITLMYMCLNAVWYRTSVTEYRGEFGLLDVSLRNVTVGAIICGMVIPVALVLEFLFRRSKPKYASSVTSKDEVEDWDQDYPSGKPNEQDSEDTSEHVPPVMTYSLLDQSIMNWPNIQTWAQKQWIKRQQSHLTNTAYPNDRTEDGLGNMIKPTAAIVGSPIVKQAMSEMDQASSGFEDCNSLIRPKASMDSTHTTAAPSVAESMRTHKPKSLPDSLRMSKPASEMDSTRTSKAPSISSSGSHKSSVINERKCRRNNRFYLPYWCRYIAWTICGILCVGSAVITAMYGYRFGVTKSTLWLQSLFFSAMICVFISTPLLIIIAVLHAAIHYKNDPTTVLDIYDIFNRVKAKQDLLKWKKQMEMWFEGDALDRAVSARQRSRYLRFARPPQEKQLIEARKKVIKEKKALSLFRESVMFVITTCLLLVMAYSKNTSEKYSLNKAVRTRLCKTGSPNFLQIKSHSDWYIWTKTGLLDSLDVFDRLDNGNQSIDLDYKESNYLIGSVQLRQQRVHSVSCPGKLPYVTSSCLSSDQSHDQKLVSNVSNMRYQNGFLGNLIFGNYSIYDGTGYIVSLNTSRATATKQLDWLQNNKWLDRTTRAVFVEFTVYNAPKNLFIAVDLLLELPPIGVAVPIAKVTSTHVFRYTSTWDNVLLACELLFFLVTMIGIKKEACRMMEKQKKYFVLPWNILNMIICVISLVFCLCYVYRFVIVSATVEGLRNTYYEQYVDVSFITMWDEILRWLVGVLIFLFTVKSLRLLRYTKLFVVFGDVYRKARREIILFFALFSILQAGYASMGHVLFGSAVTSYRNIWGSLMAVTALLTGNQNVPDNWEPAHGLSTNIFLFCVCVFMMGLLMAYMVAILSHYFKSRKKRRLLAMSGQEAMLFYWTQFQYLVGLKKKGIQEEPEIILPPEFTMAEIEYQVDELLFRMNALSGTHGLPEKPPCYLTDSDCTYGAGDDGISSGGSEPIPTYIDDRLEQRVQKIEDNLCSQEPFLAQLLKFDAVGMDMLSQEKEKQLRSHLELEIFRQLQIQRQDLKVSDHKTAESKTKYDSQQTKSVQSGAVTGTEDISWNIGQESTSSDEAKLLPSPEKSSRPKYGPSNITIQAIQDLLNKSAQDYKDFHNENSSSNPDSPRDKVAFTKTRKDTDNKIRAKQPQNSSTSSSEKISPDLSLNHSNIYDKDNIKKPTKPTFLHSRDSSLSDAQKNSPILKLRTHNVDKSAKLEPSYTGVERLIESSSGSEQDGFQVGRKLLGKRSLRKTKSRGKGKGADEGLGPGLVLDELDCEEGDFSQEFSVEGLHKELMDVYEERMKELKTGGTEHLVRADVHHSSDSQ